MRGASSYCFPRLCAIAAHCDLEGGSVVWLEKKPEISKIGPKIIKKRPEKVSLKIFEYFQKNQEKIKNFTSKIHFFFSVLQNHFSQPPEVRWRPDFAGASPVTQIFVFFVVLNQHVYFRTNF